MIKNLVSAIDYSLFAEVALAVFVASFLAIVIGTMRLKKSAVDRYASIPLSDEPQDPRHD